MNIDQIKRMKKNTHTITSIDSGKNWQNSISLQDRSTQNLTIEESNLNITIIKKKIRKSHSKVHTHGKI